MSKPVPRPRKKAEFELDFVTRQAEKGWRDLLAASRNAVADAWDRLTIAPDDEDGQRLYRLRGDLGCGSYDGVDHDRYQLKLPHGARIWYFVVRDANGIGGRVLLEQVHTRHPNETK